MRKKIMGVLMALTLAGLWGACSTKSPTGNVTPIKVTFATTDRVVSFTITGPKGAKAFLPEVRCGSATGPGGTFTQGLPAGYEATGLALGSYSITIPVYTDGGNLVDQLCWGTKGTLHVAQGGTTWVFEAEVKWAPAP